MGWLARTIASWGGAAQKREIRDFVTKLAALDSDEVAMMVVAAAEWRNRIKDTEGIDLKLPAVAIIQQPSLTYSFSRTVQNLQSTGHFAAAAGLIVWVHSLRAITDPLLRPDGRAMWRELARGFPHVLTAADHIEKTTGKVLEIDDWQAVPEGLGPKR